MNEDSPSPRTNTNADGGRSPFDVWASTRMTAGSPRMISPGGECQTANAGAGPPPPAAAAGTGAATAPIVAATQIAPSLDARFRNPEPSRKEATGRPAAGEPNGT